MTAYWLPRNLHPAAWWLWALGLATAASRTTNPMLLALILAVVVYVVINRRSDAPWALAFRLYLLLGAFIIVMRLVYRIIFGGGEGDTILFTLPEIPLPAWAAGIQLFGQVTVESLLGGAYDGLRLATMLICVGAANALANPKRLLKSVPSALYEAGSAVVVAISVFPQLAESVVRVGRARSLRGSTEKGIRAFRAIAIPVLEDALDRSLRLAAAMDSRGYGRAGTLTGRARAFTGALLVAGLVGICVGVYGVLDGTTPRYLAGPMLAAGVAVAAAGMISAGRRVQRSTYRPDLWRLAELIAAACGIAAAVALYRSSSVDPTNLNPSLRPLTWPQVDLIPAVGVLLAVLPAWLVPPPANDLEEAER
ncbi:energy-coupling factor transporter transmembrane protein EcfT [Kribbella sp. NBC_00709]|uniref:energy-coupling factor transporter transmembrane component T n=1 Tax=Kribbella sp. NBC_00709 TaxID=2975972 RepID=UPI002E293A50|nr:energy-coupling factor transporter transmembrane component T [Kribbella sp. NBC_00709]